MKDNPRVSLASSPKQKSEKLILLLIVTLLVVTSSNLLFKSYGAIIFYVPILLLTFFTIKSNFCRTIFTLSVLLNSCFLLITSLLFLYNIESIYGANDELKMATEVRHAISAWNEGVFTSPKIEASVWAYFVSLPSFLSIFFGGEVGLSIKYASAIFGGLIPIACYGISCQIYDLKTARLSAYIATLLPIFLYYSGVGVRDIHIALLMAATIAFCLQAHFVRRKPLLSLLTVFLLLAITYGLRVENAKFLTPFALLLLYFQFAPKSTFNYKATASLIVLGLIFIPIFLFTDLFIGNPVDEVSKLIEKFQNIGEQREGSLGNSIRNLPFPINYLLIGLTGTLGPFPPYRLVESPFIQASSIDSIKNITPILDFSLSRTIKAFGYFVWQILILHSLTYFLITKGRRIPTSGYYILFVSFLYLMLVSMISLNEGRLFVIYPLLIPFIARSLNSAGLKGSNILAASGIVLLTYVLAGVSFIYLKA